jgi:hypothetical protein
MTYAVIYMIRSILCVRHAIAIEIRESIQKSLFFSILVVLDYSAISFFETLEFQTPTW